MSIDVSISLVACNQRADLERLLPSLTAAASLVKSQILLVDNLSIDGTADFVSRDYPEVQITRNPNRTGYGGNHNINLERAEGFYFAIMNSDMVVTREVFAALRDYMTEYPDIGLLSPKILSQDGTIQGLNKRYPTLLDLFLRRFVPNKYERYVRRRMDFYEMRDVGYDQVCDVPFLSGAFMFVRTDLLRSLHGFDPRYFLYFEDVDLCRRIQRTHRTVYFPSAVVTHCWKRAARTNWKYTYYFMKSALRYFERWGYKLY